MRRYSLLLTLLLTSCASIIDLEERDVGDGGLGSSGSASCATYCDDAEQLCTAEREVQLFANKETCLAVCDKYSKDPNPAGNTLACRQGQLDKLRSAGVVEARTYCPGASPGGGAASGGNDSSACGTDCEGFCALRQAACPAKFVESDCIRKCQALPASTDPFNADANFGSGKDDLQCRIAHLSAAALYGSQMGREGDRDNHCSHSGIRSEVQCDVSKDNLPQCEDYCKLVMGACTGDAAVYEDLDQCKAFCGALTPGSATDKLTVKTLRCVREGAYDALEIGIRECPNAGPAPDRCGTGRCQSYCLLAEQGCPTLFKTTYPGGQSECETECRTLPGSRNNDPYSITLGASSTSSELSCRVRRIPRVFKAGIDSAECQGVVGQGACL